MWDENMLHVFIYLEIQSFLILQKHVKFHFHFYSETFLLKIVATFKQKII